MSAVAHVPGAAWAATHRLVVLALVTALVAAVVVLAVVLLTGDATVAGTSPTLPAHDAGCAGARPHTAC
ncbi:hypothetical protein [Modestobacter versicolor]|uniref:hypothetical protein n=1 Tax=Modestobacter versicolor TaxID=429133 RepID=UPI0034DF2FC2